MSAVVGRGALPIVPARWMAIGEWRAHPARLIVGILAIAIGVALGFAVHLVNRTALASFDRAIASVNGAADLQVHSATPAGFAEGLYPRVAMVAGVASASPVVELAASTGKLAIPGTTATGSRLTLLGIDVLRAAKVTPSLIGMPVRSGSGIDSRRAAGFDSDAIFVSRAALQSMHRRSGSPSPG